MNMKHTEKGRTQDNTEEATCRIKDNLLYVKYKDMRSKIIYKIEVNNGFLQLQNLRNMPILLIKLKKV